MHKLSIGDALSKGWSLFIRRGWYLFGVTSAVGLLAALVSGNMVAAALAYVIMAGYLSLLLKHARNEQVVFDDLFSVDIRWVYFAFGSLIKGLLITLGLCLFIVPGLYLASRWLFSGLLIIDQGMRPIEALRASSQLTEGYRGKLFWYIILATIMLLIGSLFLVVGVFAAAAVVNLTTIALFWRLQEIQYLKQQEQ